MLQNKTNKTHTFYSFAPIRFYCSAYSDFGNKRKTDVKAQLNRHAPLPHTHTCTHSCIPYRIDQRMTTTTPPNPFKCVVSFCIRISCAHISTSQIHRKLDGKKLTHAHHYEHELLRCHYSDSTGNFAHFDFEFLSPYSDAVLGFRLSALCLCRFLLPNLSYIVSRRVHLCKCAHTHAPTLIDVPWIPYQF